MKRFFAIGCFLIVLLLLSVTTGAENSCVDCHEGLPPTSIPAHGIEEWKGSVHARHGITCEHCHRGDPSAKMKEEAHKGIVASHQPESPLYFKRIPETCGTCHVTEFTEFKKSYHYKELKRSGQGPNCLTCHGAMAVRVPKPQELDQTCSVCHAARPVAGEALVLLNQAGGLLVRWEALLHGLKGKGVAVTADEALFVENRNLFEEVKRHWHSFDMKSVMKNSHQIISTAAHHIERLKLKGAGR